jgi:hypothetical protein
MIIDINQLNNKAMRKLIIAFSAVLFSQFSFGQAISDNATIPVSVTLNSILRLQVKTGGNIQFVFNTMDNYNSGIATSAATTTTFAVSSSRAFNVSMGAEDGTFIGVENGLTLPLNVVEYNTFTSTGIGKKHAASTWDPLLAIAGTDNIVLNGVAGGTLANRSYTIQWRAGVTNKVLNYPADVYVTNVYLNLIAL